MSVWKHFAFIVACRRNIVLLALAALFTGQIPQIFNFIQPAKAVGNNPPVYLPLVLAGPPHTFYGVEILPRELLKPQAIQSTTELGISWVRMNGISWREIQPNQGDAYKWSTLERFEAQLSAANNAGLTPVVVVRDSPSWATGREATCAAVLSEHLDDFAAFMHALVLHLKEKSIHVKYWELGNEPDVDPRLVSPRSPYGCWGDIDDREYYGGQHYGNMLKVVTPAIKSANPFAQVITGGLLLGIPNTKAENYGKPERFFEGILKSGAAPYFDIVAYHEYIVYTGTDDNLIIGPEEWAGYGGMSKGKPTYLREIMSRYNVSKPLMLNETALLCDDTPPSASRSAGRCYAQSPEFIQRFQEVQADLAAPLMVRALGSGVDAVMWFTLSSGGWRYSDLLDSAYNPRPAFRAIQALITHTGSALKYPVSIDDYGPNVEAYRFVHNSDVVDVVWSPDQSPQTIRSAVQIYAVYDRDGNQIQPKYSKNLAVIKISSGAVYIHRSP